MATTEANIEKALFGRVATLVLNPALPIAWPNKEFPGKSSLGVQLPMPLEYIRVDHFLNKNHRMFLGSSDPSWRTGFIQLLVVIPLNKSSTAAIEIAGKVAEHFPADLLLYSEGIRVKVMAAPDVGSFIETPISWNTPVTVYYEVSA